MSDSSSSSPKYQSGSNYLGRGILQGFTDELSILRRRLEFSQGEIERLTKELIKARDESTKVQVDSSGKMWALEQELETLHRFVEGREKALDEAQQTCRRLEHELDRSNKKLERFDVLEDQLRFKQRELDAKKATIARLERERRQWQDRLNERSAPPPAEEKVPVASVADAASLNPASQPIRKPIWHLLLAAVLVVVGLLAAAMSKPGKYFFSVGFSEPVATIAASASDPFEPIVSEAMVVELPEVGQSKSRHANQTSVFPEAIPTRRIQDRLRSGAPGPALILLNAGTFAMGSRPGIATDDAFPVHEVNIDQTLIGVNEITFAEYDTFAQATGRRLPNDFDRGRGDHPVVDVTWWDAQAYVDWLSDQTGKTYRLPSEAEWEYAARAGSTSAYWWGYQLDVMRAVCFECGSPWDDWSTAPVGRFAPNRFGLYDTAGNAMEWVADCYQANYRAAPTDGQARQSADGSCQFRVARGGAFNKPARSMRSASRHRFAPGTSLNMLGFRVARNANT